LFFPKGSAKGTSHEIQAFFDEEHQNDFKLVVKKHLCGIFEGSQRVPKVPNGVLHFANINFSSTKISFVGSFFLGHPNNFVDRRMRHREWMAWMYSAQKITPFIHNASVTWVGLGSSTQTQILFIHDV